MEFRYIRRKQAMRNELFTFTEINLIESGFKEILKLELM